MATSCKEGTAAKQRRSGSKGCIFKTRFQQWIFTAESPLKSTLPLVICDHNINSCERRIGWQLLQRCNIPICKRSTRVVAIFCWIRAYLAWFVSSGMANHIFLLENQLCCTSVSDLNWGPTTERIEKRRKILAPGGIRTHEFCSLGVCSIAVLQPLPQGGGKLIQTYLAPVQPRCPGGRRRDSTRRSLLRRWPRSRARPDRSGGPVRRPRSSSRKCPSLRIRRCRRLHRTSPPSASSVTSGCPKL